MGCDDLTSCLAFLCAHLSFTALKKPAHQGQTGTLRTPTTLFCRGKGTWANEVQNPNCSLMDSPYEAFLDISNRRHVIPRCQRLVICTTQPRQSRAQDGNRLRAGLRVTASQVCWTSLIFRTSTAILLSREWRKMSANFTCHSTSVCLYEVRAWTACENVSSTAVSKIRISASDASNCSLVTPDSGIEPSIGWTTIQWSGKKDDHFALERQLVKLSLRFPGDRLQICSLATLRLRH